MAPEPLEPGSQGEGASQRSRAPSTRGQRCPGGRVRSLEAQRLAKWRSPLKTCAWAARGPPPRVWPRGLDTRGGATALRPEGAHSQAAWKVLEGWRDTCIPQHLALSGAAPDVAASGWCAGKVRRLPPPGRPRPVTWG